MTQDSIDSLYHYEYSYDITFMVPCYNEEENILSTIEKIYRVLGKYSISFEVIIIDDYSTDNTKIICDKLIGSGKYRDLKIISNNRNMGLGYNYKEGAFIGKGEYYMLINGDNSENDDYLVNILDKFKQADMVIPNFVGSDNRKITRVILSKIFTKCVNIISGYNLKYYNGTVLHKRYNVMRYQPETNGFAYQAEIIVNLLNLGKTFIEVDVVNNDIFITKSATTVFNLRNIMSVINSIIQIMIRRIRMYMFGY